MREKLAQMKEQAKTRLPEDALEVIQRATEELENSGVAEQALEPGDQAPDFTLPNAEGQPVSSKELRGRGPLVVTFYRGVW